MRCAPHKISVWLCLNQQLRKLALSTWLLSSVYLSSSHVYHCWADSLSWRPNYIFTFNAAVIAVQECGSVCVRVHVSTYLCMSSASLHSYSNWQMLPKPPAPPRSVNQRQVPEGEHVQCHTSLSWTAAFNMHNMPHPWMHSHMCIHTCLHICDESNPEMHTSPKGPRTVLSSYVKLLHALRTNVVVSRLLHYSEWVQGVIKTLVVTS